MSRGKRNWIILIGAFLLLACIPLVRLWSSLGAEKHLRELKAAGIPTSGRELDNFYKHLPALENQALPVIEATQLLVRAPADANPYAGKFHFPPAGEPLPGDLRKVIEEQLKRNEPVLAKVREVVPGGRARHPINLSAGAYTLLPHLAQIKGIGQLLKLEAVFAAENGDSQRAVEALLAGLAVTGTLKDEPLLISQLVRFATLAILLDAMERTLSATVLTEPQLLQLQEAVRRTELEGEEAMRKALFGERAIGLDVFTMSPSELDKLGSGGTSGGASFEDNVRVLLLALHHALGLRALDKSHYLKIMAGYDLVNTSPFPERFQKAREFRVSVEDLLQNRLTRLAVLTRLLVPVGNQATEKEAAHVAHLRCARVALAVARYRLANGGNLPKDLPDLVPRYFAATPEDPVDGSALELHPGQVTGFSVRAPGASREREKSDRKDRSQPVGFSIAR